MEAGYSARTDMSVLAKRSHKPADQRREQILDCALEVFSHKGYHGSSIADVCARARIGRATLYQYFEDKRDLLRALADRVATKIIRSLQDRPALRLSASRLPSEEAALEFMTGRIVTVLTIVFDDAATTRLVLRAGRGADGVADELLARVEQAQLAIIVADLEEGKRVGLLRPIDIPLAAQLFLGGIQKAVLASLDEDRPMDLQAFAREAATYQLRAVLLAPKDLRSHHADPATAAPATRNDLGE
jgi:AcrR family transcriptional regulator